MRLAELSELPVEELRRRLLDAGAEEPPRGAIQALLDDPRQGARQIGEQLKKRALKRGVEERRLTRLSEYEQALWDQGIELVGGVDEVGMAPLAGPVIAAAVILPRGARLKGVNDSKQLTSEEREGLAPQIRAQAVAWGIGRAEVGEIDTINIYQAGLLALRRAVLAMAEQPQHLLIDARKLPELKMPQTPIIKGDAKSITIGAASIIAKVHRDALMAEMDATYPGYGFAEHKGYPTPVHLEALGRLGACDIHRRSFEPVRKALGLVPEQRGFDFAK